MEKTPPRIHLDRITKRFSDSGVVACDQVSLDLKPGEIWALVGENGAGKSTLMHILAGSLPQDSGTISFADPEEARSVGMVYQKLPWCRTLSAWENIFLGEFPRTPWGTIDRKKVLQLLDRTLEAYNLPVDPMKPLKYQTPPDLIMLSLAGFLAKDTRTIIIDEGTAAFTDHKSPFLKELFNRLKEEGRTVIFITHKIPEALALSDRIAVMRGGRLVAVRDADKTDRDELAHLMAGEAMPREMRVFDKLSRPGKKILEVSNLSGPPAPFPLKNISWNLRSGEILVITGFRDHGLSDLEDLLSGRKSSSDGKIYLEGIDVGAMIPRRRRQLGMTYIPTDRLLRGSSQESTVEENMILLNYRRFQKFGILKKEEIRQFSKSLGSRFGIQAGRKQKLRALSGGNIQRVILSRELTGHSDKVPTVVLLSEPTWGLDIMGRQRLYEELLTLKEKGTALVILSTDMEETLALGDRIAVMHQGSLWGPKKREDLTKDQILRKMVGLNEDEQLL